MANHWGGNFLSFPQTNDPAMGGYTRLVSIVSPNAVDLPTAITLVNEIKTKLNAAGHWTAAISNGKIDQPNNP